MQFKAMLRAAYVNGKWGASWREREDSVKKSCSTERVYLVVFRHTEVEAASQAGLGSARHAGQG